LVLKQSQPASPPNSIDDSIVDSIRIFGAGRVVPYGHLAGALVCGILLRWFFISHFNPFAGDAKFYEELARNWLYHGVYGRFLHGQLLPTDERVPGYPAFLAAIYKTLGQSRAAVTSVQVAVDVMTSVLTALIAARLAPVQYRAVSIHSQLHRRCADGNLSDVHHHARRANFRLRANASGHENRARPNFK
jgi:hypothetical protein